MLTLGFSWGSSGLSLEEEQYLQEQLALKMKALLEEHGWEDSFGRDPVLILIEYEQLNENGENEDEL